MASMCPPTFQSPRTDSNVHNLNFTNSRFTSSNFSRRWSESAFPLSMIPDSTSCCRCLNKSSGGDNSDSGSGDSWQWAFGIHETVVNAIKRIDDYLSSFGDQGMERSQVVAENDEEEWDWEKWRQHFVEVDEQERIVSVLMSQLASAVEREDYEDAARIKVAIAAAATNDTVGRVMSHLKKCVAEERYEDAALIRDYTGAGLVGWWAGISEDANDPYGRIIRITAEYGRYVARNYNPRQLATASYGAPLFEVYLTNNKKGDYKQQAVYLKHKGSPQDLYLPSFKSAGSSRSLDSRDARDNKSKVSERSSEDTDSEDKHDDAVFFDNILRKMIPGVKVKVVKLPAPEKVDMDIISKVIEPITDEEEDENECDSEDVDSDDEFKSDNDDDNIDIERDSASGESEEDDQNKFSVVVVVGDGFIQKLSRDAHIKDRLRFPARLEKKGRTSFTFTIEEDASERLSGGDGQSPENKRPKLQQRSIDHVMLDLIKSTDKGKVPMKVLKDVCELINLIVSQARNSEPLSGSTTFHRIEIPLSPDPLNGDIIFSLFIDGAWRATPHICVVAPSSLPVLLFACCFMLLQHVNRKCIRLSGLYIGAHGRYASEVIHMKRRFGQWKEDGNTKNPSKVEFYEYVEAVKLTGDAHVPAGQVAFRAKVGKRYQLPHKGIIPEEFGVIARYRGQGRLAEPGFRNPQWVDGELVILGGKYIKGPPVVGFIYGAPDHHFLVFFNRLKLLD